MPQGPQLAEGAEKVLEDAECFPGSPEFIRVGPKIPPGLYAATASALPARIFPALPAPPSSLLIYIISIYKLWAYKSYKPISV